MTVEVSSDATKEIRSVPVSRDLPKIPELDLDNDLDRSNKKFEHLSESEYNDYVRRRRRRKKHLPDHLSRPVSPELSGEGKPVRSSGCIFTVLGTSFTGCPISGTIEAFEVSWHCEKNSTAQLVEDHTSAF